MPYHGHMTTTRRRTVALIAQTVLLLGMALAVTIQAATYDAPEGAYAPGKTGLDWGTHQNVPTWTTDMADRFPACHDAATQPEGVTPAAVVVVHQDATVERVTFQQAWDDTHDQTWANDVWVVGSCK